MSQVDVEYKVMSALGGTSFPVPKMYLYCEDKTIMGQEFYVMEYIKVQSQNRSDTKITFETTELLHLS